MMPPKVVAILLLLLSVTISLQHAAGECTETQEAILENCKGYIRKDAPPRKVPAHKSYCCIKVRDVPERDMECIMHIWSPDRSREGAEQRTEDPKSERFLQTRAGKKLLIHFIRLHIYIEVLIIRLVLFLLQVIM